MATQLELLRQDAVDIFQQGLDAANPYQAVKNSLAMVGGHLEIALERKRGFQKAYWAMEKNPCHRFWESSCCYG